MIGVIDYGMGNLGSVLNALSHLGHDATIVSTPGALLDVDHMILPGVGAFGEAMANLRSQGWDSALRERVDAGVPLLGICLGMQLLFSKGHEHGEHAGLDLIPGRVPRFDLAQEFRVPHVGWNSLTYARKHPVFQGVKAQVDVYFVHSYHCVPDNAEDVVAHSDHGGLFVAAVARRNVVGMQYHPEKSQPGGLRMLDNFAQWDGSDEC